MSDSLRPHGLQHIRLLSYRYMYIYLYTDIDIDIDIDIFFLKSGFCLSIAGER